MTSSSLSDAALIWHSRRGMLELDLILSRFVTQHLTQLNEAERQAYAHLLTQADPDLFNWLMGYEIPVDPLCKQMVAMIRTG